jgi:hypothetical protein
MVMIHQWVLQDDPHPELFVWQQEISEEMR